MPRKTTPLVLQAKQAECGLASLAMVAAHYGHDLSLGVMRQRYAHLNHGPTLRTILSMSDALGLVARPVRIELAEIRQLKLPAILHWRFDHFVVATEVRRRKIVIHDPAVGRRILSINQFSDSFTGVAVEFSRVPDFHPERGSRQSVLAGLLGSVEGLGRYLSLVLVLLFVSETLALAPPIATQLLIDEIVLGQDSHWLHRMLAGVGLVMLTMLAIDSMRRWIALYAGTRLATDSTTGVVRHLLSLPTAFIADRPVGDLMSRLESLRPIRAAMIDTFLQGIVQIMVVLTTTALMIYYSPMLTLLSAGALVVIVVIHGLLLPATRALNLESVVALAGASNSLIETLRSFRTVRTLGLEAQRLRHWQQSFINATNTGARQARLGIAASLGQGLVGSAEQLLFLAIGISGVIARELTLGTLFACMSLRGRLGAAVIRLIAVMRELYLLQSHLHRVGDIVAEQPEARASAASYRARITGDVSCRRLTFSYPGGAKILRDFSCTIAAGESVVIAGPSGTGKTTLLHLLSTTLRPESGAVLIDGIECQLWDPQSLRRQFGIVLQQDRLFQGSIADNICCFDSAPDVARIREVACIAEIWSHLATLPMTVHTPISATGAGLSGGQVQRLLLARAIYRRPRILFLDEATSHLDVDTEARVLQNLRDLGITTISIAHRQAVIEQATRIIRLA